jgi:carbon monoxide dehydrogenase subunit G
VKVSGSVQLNAPRERVWQALNDPAVLVRTIPGCQRLEAVDTDAYRMTLSAGVAAIKGIYTGEVRLSGQQPPVTFVLTAAGAGAPGTVSANVVVSLVAATEATTTVTYDADAVIGGMIGGVGQRMLGGVAKKTAAEFFSAVDDVLTGKVESASPAAAAATVPGDETARDARTGVMGTRSATGVFEAPGMTATFPAAPAGGFVRGAMVGAGAALLGVLVGGLLVGRRRTG